MVLAPANTPRSSPVRIAVLDGPIDATHPCFSGARFEFPIGQPSFQPDAPAAQHGTHIASLLFGQPGGAVDGLSPDCTGIFIPVFGEAADLRCTQIDLARAIAIALEHHADIINISGGQFIGDCVTETDLAALLSVCEERRVLVVAATGNDGCDCSHVPACVATVLAVGAVNRSGRLLASSNWGPAYAAHGLLAPGEAIVGAVPGSGTAARTGTSFATAIASGTAARMLAAARTAGEAADPLAVRAALIGTVIAGWGADAARRGPEAGRPPAIHSNQTGNRGRANMTLSGIEQTAENPSIQTAGLALPGNASNELAGLLPSAADGIVPSCAGGTCQCGGAPKDCGCGCGGAKKAEAPQLVYALGQIGYDLGSEARRDSIRQFMGGADLGAIQLIEHLDKDENIEEFERITWTLILDGSPIYALKPAGAYAAEGYARIFAAFINQVIGRDVEKGRKKVLKKVGLFGVPGRLAGSMRLMSGETVPILVPATRGFTDWDVDRAITAFIEQLAKQEVGGESEETRIARFDSIRLALEGFLPDFRDLFTRKYRNLGLLGRDRALNFAATAAFRAFEVLEKIPGLDLILDDVEVLKSPACRAGSECYDIRLKMFRQSDITAAIHIFQFTVDVSTTIPVSIGNTSNWRERP